MYPESKMSAQYVKTKSRCTMRGEWYEVKVAALLFLRSKNSDWVTRFQLATNVMGAGALDDIVYRMLLSDDTPTWYTSFIQIKHKDRTTLRTGSLSGTVGDFSLRKYLNSYNEIKRAKSDDDYANKIFLEGPFDCFRFIIYTNAKADTGLIEQISKYSDSFKSDSVIEKLLKSNAENEVIFRIGSEKTGNLLSFADGEDISYDDSEFLEKLTVFSGQPTESDLDDVIKKELMIACGGAVSDAGAIYRIFEALFKQWWRDSNEVLDENSDILQKAIYQLSAEVELTKQTEQCTLKLDFEEHVRKVFSGFHSIPIICVSSNGTSLKICATKVLRFLHAEKLSFTLISLEYLQRHRSILLSDWQYGYKDYLVIIHDFQDSNNHNMIASLSTDIIEIVQCNSNKKVIIVSCQLCSLAKHLTKILSADEYNIVVLPFDFTDLDQTTKEKLFRTQVLFQGHNMSLKSISGENVNWGKLLFSDRIVETLVSQCSIVIGVKLPNTIQHFIRRRLKRQQFLKRDIINSENTTDTFAVSGSTVHEMQKSVLHHELVCSVRRDLVTSKDEPRAAKYPAGIKPKYLVLDPNNPAREFNDLCGTGSTLHWLHVEDEIVRWIKSTGSISTIRKYIDRERGAIIQSQKILDNDDKIVLIIAEPGMGKTTLMLTLAQKAKKSNPTDWVILINLRDHTELLNQSSIINSFEFLSSALHIGSELEKTFLRVSLEETGKIIIFLDSFDEICPRYEEEGSILLRNIMNTKVKKLVVTSRHCMQRMLENHLTTLAYNISEFSEKDQQMFLRQFWSQSSTPMTSVQLNAFITKLVQSVNVFDHEKRLLGIPLQTMMLAEIFHDHVMDPEKVTCPKQIDILNLFEQFIDKKFIVFFRKGKSILNRENSRRKFFQNHMHAALALLVSGEDNKGLKSKLDILASADVFLRHIEEGEDNSGVIVSVVKNKPNFIHRMFAEYFAGIWFAENYHLNRDFLVDHFFLSHYNVVRNMFDRILSKGYRLHEAVLDKDMLLLEALLETEGYDINSQDQGGRTALHLATALEFEVTNTVFKYRVHERYIGPRPRHIVELILEKGSSVDITDSVLMWTPLEYAFHTRSWDAMEFLLQNKANSKNLILSKQLLEGGDLLKAVFSNRYLNLLKLMLDRKLPVDYQIEGKCLLHLACQYGYVDFVELLLSKGANNVSRDQYGHVSLHFASKFGHTDVVRVLLEKSSNFKLSTFRETGLKFNWFQKYVNTTSVFGESALHVARTPDIVPLLISHGANIYGRDKLKRTCLHTAIHRCRLLVAEAIISAVESSNGNVVQFVNIRDGIDISAIGYASRSGYSDGFCLLISHGADIWARGKLGRTILHNAANSHVAKAIIESLGEDKVKIVKYIDILDKEGQSAMLVASSLGYSDVVCYLIACGADVWIRDKWGKTCLHRASERGRLLEAKALIESLGSRKASIVEYIAIRDSGGLTARDVAVKPSDIDVFYQDERESFVAWIDKTLRENS